MLLLILTLTEAKGDLTGKSIPVTNEESTMPQPPRKFNPLDELLRFYQRFLSNQIQADCLYHTSCSRFTRLKLKEDGIKGFFIGLDQFIHCTAGMELEYPTNQIQSGKVVRD